MRARQAIADQFSTFLQFEADRFSAWVTDPRLRRSMQQCLAQAANSSETFWALYWHKRWQAQPQGLARHHLAAYSQEPCYWAAYKTTGQFTSLQYTLADCFQLAIAHLDKILKGFNPQQGFSFKTYASATLSSLIRESLRQRQEVDICTDWGLLRKTSQKRLTEALQTRGLAAGVITRFILMWRCFNTLYLPQQASGTRKLPKPDANTWRAIAQLYNAECASIGTDRATVAEIESAIVACARAVRDYLYPSTVSINTPKPGQEGGEFLDDLPDTAQPSLIQQWISDDEQQQRQEQRTQLNALLITTLSQLDAESQTILTLYYQQNLTQQQMATALNTRQYTISRRLTRARETLLKQLAHWVSETLHIAPTSDVLNNTSAALEEWLTAHFASASPSTAHASISASDR